jgi:hypothetical protein
MTDAGTVTLRARDGRPLDDPGVRNVVIATAESIGERLGVGVRVLDADGASITIEVDGGTLPAMGLAAELRRATDRWHEARHGVALWSPLEGHGDGH